MNRSSCLSLSRVTRCVLALLVLSIACSSPIQVVDGVTVRDSDFTVINVIDEPASLRAFEELWRTRKLIQSEPRPVSEYPFKVDIRANVGSGRWLYRKDGTMTLLSVKFSGVYVIEDSASLNSLLGLGST